MDCVVCNVVIYASQTKPITNYTICTLQTTLLFEGIYSCIFVHSVCLSENKLGAVFVHLSICLSFWSIRPLTAVPESSSVFSPTLSPLTHPLHNKLQRLQAVFLHELFIMTQQIFLPLPGLNASAGPARLCGRSTCCQVPCSV